MNLRKYLGKGNKNSSNNILNSLFYCSNMVTNNPSYGCKLEKQNQPFPGPETGPYHKLVYTDTDNQYTVTQDEIYSLAEIGGDGCCTTEQQGYSVLKFNKI